MIKHRGIEEGEMQMEIANDMNFPQSVSTGSFDRQNDQDISRATIALKKQIFLFVDSKK